MDEDTFIQLLQSILEPDTERVKAATAALRKDYYPNPESLAFLLKILTSHESPQLRQLAAVEARTLVAKHWVSIPDGAKPNVRRTLLESTLAEQESLVRHSEARVIAAIAKIDLEDGEWSELPGILSAAAKHDQVTHRETGVYILFTLLEVMGDGFVSQMHDLFVLFNHTIQDRESAEVRINTMLALSRMAMVIDPDEDPTSLSEFREILPKMVHVLAEVVKAGDEDKVVQAFEVFQTVLGCDSQLISNIFKDLISLMMEMASSLELAEDSRSQALSFLMQCVKYRKLKVQGLRLGETLTLKALQIVTELGDLRNDEEDATPAKTALGLLDVLSQSLPPAQVMVPLMLALPKYVNSSDPNYRRAGILSLGFCVEGAPDFIGSQLNEIMPLVFRLLQDNDVKVRQATLHAFARLAEEVGEEMAKEHETLVPLLVQNLEAVMTTGGDKKHEEQKIDIMTGACNALDCLLDGMDADISGKYITRLAPLFTRLFDHPEFRVKAAAVGAMGSLAASSEKNFLPYFEKTVEVLSPYINLKESVDELDLRGTVTDAMGHIASAVGPEAFQKYVLPLMETSEQALQLGNPQLKETSFILWSGLSKVYKDQFTPFLAGVSKALFESLKQEETDLEVELGPEAQELLGSEITVAGKRLKISNSEGNDSRAILSRVNGNADEDEVIDVEDLDDDDSAWDDLTAVTAVAMEKEIALEVLGDIIGATRKSFLPYIQETVQIALGLTDHSYEGIRKSSIGTLWRAYAALYEISEEDGQMAKWEPGLPLVAKPTEDLKKLGGVILTATIPIWEDEVDRAVVTDINRNVSATLKLCGPAVINEAKALDTIVTILISILTKKHPCQQDMGEEEEELEVQESSEYDWLVVDTAMDVMSGLAIALGPTFGRLWKVFEKTILAYAGSSESLERSSAVGNIAECISGMESSVTEYTKTLLTNLIHRLDDEEVEVKSNATYAVGLLCQYSTSDTLLQQAYPIILTKLEPLLHTESARLLDNSVGCVSRMITKHPSRVPLDNVLPILVGAMPLKADYDENEPLWDMIIQLYQKSNPYIESQTSALIPVIEQVLKGPEEQLDTETREKVAQLHTYLRSK